MCKDFALFFKNHLTGLATVFYRKIE